VIDDPHDMQSLDTMEEAVHFDLVAKRGSCIEASSLVDWKEQLRRILKPILTDFVESRPSVLVYEPGCGEASFFEMTKVHDVDYIGSDVSLQSLLKALKTSRGANRMRLLVRADANRQLLADDKADLVFCHAALHHLKILAALHAIARSIKRGSLLVISEPDALNPIAAIGRIIVRRGCYHTKGEKALLPTYVQQCCTMLGFKLIYQTRCASLSGPLSYFLGLLSVKEWRLMKLVSDLCSYLDVLLSRLNLWGYYFVQIYERVI